MMERKVIRTTAEVVRLSKRGGIIRRDYHSWFVVLDGKGTLISRRVAQNLLKNELLSPVDDTDGYRKDYKLKDQ